MESTTLIIVILVIILCVCLLLFSSFAFTFSQSSSQETSNRTADDVVDSSDKVVDSVASAGTVEPNQVDSLTGAPIVDDSTPFCSGEDEWKHPLDSRCMVGKCVPKGTCRDPNTIPRKKTDDDKYVCDYSECLANFCKGEDEYLGANDGKCYVGNCESRGICTNANAIRRIENEEGKWVCDYSECDGGIIGKQCNLDGSCDAGGYCKDGVCYATCDVSDEQYNSLINHFNSTENSMMNGGGGINGVSGYNNIISTATKDNIVNFCGPIPYDASNRCNYTTWESNCKELGTKGSNCFQNNTCLGNLQCVNGTCME